MSSCEHSVPLICNENSPPIGIRHFFCLCGVAINDKYLQGSLNPQKKQSSEEFESEANPENRK
jgi:hypothetical protein